MAAAGGMTRVGVHAAAALLLCTVAAAAETAISGGVVVDKAALERAQQQADGPRRRILEAARLKGVVRPADVPQQQRPQPTEREAAVATLPAALAPLQTAADLPVQSVPGVAPLEVVANAAPMIAIPQSQALPPPRLLHRVDPELPARLLRRGGGQTEVVVDLVLGTDGSVRDIAVRPGAGSDVEPAIVEALRQWRYDAQPALRPHVVRLVLRPG